MNPYISFGLAMCGVVFLALAGTAYMALFFNRRAKADLWAALEPMAEKLEGGEIDLDEATVQGRFGGHLAEGRVVANPGGMGRTFQTQLIDGAGGLPWLATISRDRDEVSVALVDMGSELDEEKVGTLTTAIEAMAADPALASTWFRLEYDPAGGNVKLSRPMHTRKELPRGETFERWCAELKELADLNRALQSAPE